MGRSVVSAALLVLGVAVALAPNAAAMQEFEERLGDEPIREEPEWPFGVVALANMGSRVLYRSVASGEVRAKDDEFFYRGATDELNQALARFVEVEAGRHEVILLPGAPEEAMWSEGEAVPYDWKLHVPGIYRRQEAQREEGTEVYSDFPNMTVHVGGRLELDGIEVPSGVTVLGMGDLTARYVAGLRSDDRRVRWNAAWMLRTVAPHADEALLPLIAALEDEDPQVRVAVAESLGSFGLKASAALPRLRDMAEEEGVAAGQRAAPLEAVRRIKEADGEDGKHYRAELARIESFRKSLAAAEAAPSKERAAQ